jgi:hypothetical protein
MQDSTVLISMPSPKQDDHQCVMISPLAQNAKQFVQFIIKRGRGAGRKCRTVCAIYVCFVFPYYLGKEGAVHAHTIGRKCRTVCAIGKRGALFMHPQSRSPQSRSQVWSPVNSNQRIAVEFPKRRCRVSCRVSQRIAVEGS